MREAEEKRTVELSRKRMTGGMARHMRESVARENMPRGRRGVRKAIP